MTKMTRAPSAEVIIVLQIFFTISLVKNSTNMQANTTGVKQNVVLKCLLMMLVFTIGFLEEF